ncbi:hypothetical protein C0992_009559, partial [Termitomyces sp. T32_za158]
WAALAPGPLRRLPIPICLRLFDGNASSTGDITHFVHLPITFANGQQQELWLLVTKLHTSAPLILGLPWLQSTNPQINWQSLTLHFDQDTMPPRSSVPFELPTFLPAPRDPGASNWASLTMKFHTPGAELAAAIHLLPLLTLNDTEPRDPSTTPEPQSPIPLPAPTPHPPNIPQNKYKGPHYPP